MQGEWYAESLRLTFFVLPNWTPRTIFSEITGSPPAEQVQRSLLGLHQETGSAFGAYFTVGQQPGRVDFVLTDTPDIATTGIAGHSPKAFFRAGPVKECLEAFDQVVRTAVPIVGGAALRVAYAITLLTETESSQSAMKVLKEALPTVVFDPGVDSDLIYQINRPRVSRLGHKLNRLARWEAIQSNILSVTVGALPIPLGTSFAARVYADISTDEKNVVPFHEAALIEIVDEVRAHALDIANKGDRK